MYTVSVCNQPTRSPQPCLSTESLNRVPALSCDRGGNVTAAGRQATLCDPMITNCYKLLCNDKFTLLYGEQSFYSLIRTSFHITTAKVRLKLPHVRQSCCKRVLWIFFLPARLYASAGTSYGPVSVCLCRSVCLCHKSEFC